MKLAISLVLLLAAGCGKKADGDAKSSEGGKASGAPTGSDTDLVEPELALPKPELAVTNVKLDIPAVPAFELPPPNPDGSRSVKEMRVRGKQLLDTEVSVHGYITWIYDCATAIAGPGDKPADVKERIEADPSVCERPKFSIGDRPDAAPARSLWVVSIPRPYFAIEMKRLPRDEIENPPANRCKPGDAKRCPQFSIGDEVTITGKFALQSEYGERNSDGLLVYGHMKNVTKNWESPASAPPIPTPSPVPAARADAPAKPAGTAIAKVRRSVFEQSQSELQDAEKAFEMKQFDTAIAKFQQAIETWPDNHRAWYGLARSYASKQDHAHAVDAAQKAVAIRPDGVMYQLVLGSALWDRAVAMAREDQAKRENRRPEDVTPDLSTVNFEKPLLHLQEAAKLEPALWRAHYMLGRIYRETGRAKEAAEAFSRACSLGAPESNPFVALSVLYGAWDYDDQALKVAEEGTKVVLTATDAAHLYAQQGWLHVKAGNHDRAIEAFTKTLDVDKANASALFGRGQAAFSKLDYVAAKRDLETFAKQAGGTLAFEKQQAARMLMDIAVKTAPPPPGN